MNIEIICPLYNAESYIENLDKTIKMQKNVNISRVRYILTYGKDNTEELLKKISADYSAIEIKDFSHSLTREKAAMESDADIVVFITQDIDIRDDKWLEKLVKPIIEGEAEASFSRQLTKFDNIEKYTREINYPAESYINSKADIEKKGLQTFFSSDASAAIKTEIFKKLNGYDGMDLKASEDMYLSFKIIMNGYRIKYCADSIIYHSHDLTLKELYKRYYNIGDFFRQNPYLDKYGTNKSGGGLAKYVLKRAIQDRNIKVLLRFIPDMATRFIGMKMGKMKSSKKDRCEETKKDLENEKSKKRFKSVLQSFQNDGKIKVNRKETINRGNELDKEPDTK